MPRTAYTSYIRGVLLFKWSLLLLWLAGCRSGAPEPSPHDARTLRPGSFLVVLQGTVADTLEGLARFRRDTSGTVVVDLIGRPDTTRGLSLELPPVEADTLEAVRRWVPGPERGAFVVGYLAWPPYTFVTEAGELVLAERERVDRVAGTFRLALGAMDLRTGELLEIEALGAFVAIPASEK
ncbi:hypothetical protein [Rhodothermus marinus]|uniref:hypothetical protein n=1 Tax=Rhodothermus marinus TaxID=29549 RepID=UPI001374CBE5|nr:hypothetical protein [Rhodothermus marinus]